jgi:hypothetical protein
MIPAQVRLKDGRIAMITWLSVGHNRTPQIGASGIFTDSQESIYNFAAPGFIISRAKNLKKRG